MNIIYSKFSNIYVEEVWGNMCNNLIHSIKEMKVDIDVDKMFETKNVDEIICLFALCM